MTDPPELFKVDWPRTTAVIALTLAGTLLTIALACGTAAEDRAPAQVELDELAESGILLPPSNSSVAPGPAIRIIIDGRSVYIDGNRVGLQSNTQQDGTHGDVFTYMASLPDSEAGRAIRVDTDGATKWTDVEPILRSAVNTGHTELTIAVRGKLDGVSVVPVTLVQKPQGVAEMPEILFVGGGGFEVQFNQDPLGIDGTDALEHWVDDNYSKGTVRLRPLATSTWASVVGALDTLMWSEDGQEPRFTEVWMEPR